MKLRFFTRLAFFMGVAALVSSCNIDDDSNYYYYPNPENVAFGLIGNASPNSGDLYFYADQNQINNPALNYGTALGYYNFYTGDRVLTVRNEAGDTLATANITLHDGDYFSAFAVNTFDNIELVTYNDSLEYPEPGHALVRFINLSPDAASIDVAGMTQTFASGLEFKEATPFMSVQSGGYDLTFKHSGSGEEIYTDTAVEFNPGRIYTVYTKGFVTPPDNSNDTFSAEKIRNY